MSHTKFHVTIEGWSSRTEKNEDTESQRGLGTLVLDDVIRIGTLHSFNYGDPGFFNCGIPTLNHLTTGSESQEKILIRVLQGVPRSLSGVPLPRIQRVTIGRIIAVIEKKEGTV